MSVKKQILLLCCLTVLLSKPVFGRDSSSGVDKVQSLKEAVSRVVSSNPRLSALADKSNGLKALIEQASYLPNPEIELESENFGGSLDGFNEAENTVALSQLIEMGGKRGARINVAKAQYDLFSKEVRSEMNELIGNLKIAFATLQRDEELQALAYEELKIAKEMLGDVQKRVKHGAVLAAELSKAELAYQTAEIQHQRAEQQVLSSKTRLVAFWGGTLSDVGTLKKMQIIEEATPGLEESNIDKTPLIEIADGQIVTAERSLDHERALRIPDLTFSAGYRRLEETDDNAFVGAISVPLPLFNRNSGSIQSAASDVAAQRKLRTNLKNKLRAEIKNLQFEFKLQVAQLRRIENSLLPAAKRAYKDFQQAFSIGRSSYLEFLDAQQNYVDTKRERVELQFSALKSQVELQKIAGSAANVVGENEHGGGK